MQSAAKVKVRGVQTVAEKYPMSSCELQYLMKTPQLDYILTDMPNHIVFF